MKSEANKKQVNGDHYKLPIQVWDFIASNNLDFFQGNIIKYVVRHAKKNGKDDLKKAKHYIDKLIELRYSPIKRSKSMPGAKESLKRV